VIGGPRFYERQEIRDALAYLRLVHQPADDLAFERIVNTPRRGIGTATLQLLHAAARAGQTSLVEAARGLITGDRLPRAARNALANFLTLLDRWRDAADRHTHTELVQLVLDESLYTAMLQADPAPDAPGRLENLKELVVAMAEFDNLTGFLEHVGLVMDNAADASGDMVNLMTLHSAKGLEFDTVFLPGWEEGLFPSQRSIEQSGLAGLEEERRLAYVGLTRARHRALVSFAANRRIHGQWQSSVRSRFVDELPKDRVELVVEPGLGPGAGWGAAAPGPSPWGSAWNSHAAGERVLLHSPPRPPVLIAGTRPPPRGHEVRKVGGFAVGDRVFHQKFGYGVIKLVEDNKLEINFEHAGDKKIMDAFVERA
jgi:DNA helicase-2/ATP-dependent DNA helicase PcrA